MTHNWLKKGTKQFGSLEITLVLFLSYAILLAIATIVEKYAGTEQAQQLYYHPLVMGIWAMFLINFITQIIRQKMPLPSLLFHSAFIWIMTGAAITHFFAYEGTMHLRQGKSSNQIFSQNDKHTINLPFTIALDQFTVNRYPGSSNPSGYKSVIDITMNGETKQGTVSVNHFLTIDGYRIYQTSYDSDEKGTILTIGYDPYGKAISYTGYFILICSMGYLLLNKNSRFQQLNKQLNKIARLTSLFLLFTYSSAQAASWNGVLVQHPNGRIMPLSSYCKQIIRKIHHADNYNGQKAVDVVMSIMKTPQKWGNQKLIYQDNNEINKRYNLSDSFVTFNDWFNPEGDYLLTNEIKRIQATPPAQRSRLDKDFLKLDERINIVYSLIQGEMLKLFPLKGDPKNRWFSPGDDLTEFAREDSLFVRQVMAWILTENDEEPVNMIKIYQQKKSNNSLPNNSRVMLEESFDEVQLTQITAMGYMTCALLLIGFVFFKPIKHKNIIKFKILTYSQAITLALSLSFMALHTFNIGLRWYIAQQAPFSNAYESMIYAGWATAFFAFLFIRRSPLTMALGTLLAGSMLLVAGMNFMDPEITPLVPVLQSPWLMFHVAVIIGGYGCFGISALLGIGTMATIASKKNPQLSSSLSITEMSTVNEMLLILGLCLMCTGTFLGAVWANESWGQYWSWDPKETWALVTILIYAFIIHSRFIKYLNNVYTLSLLSVLGFSTVLMTYFGVNYYLTGMHAYGSGTAPKSLYAIYVFYAFFIGLASVAYVREKKVRR